MFKTYHYFKFIEVLTPMKGSRILQYTSSDQLFEHCNLKPQIDLIMEFIQEELIST